MPQKGIAQTALASVPIGAALGAADEFADAMRTATSHGQRLAEAQNLQLRVAESSAEAESAQRLVLGTVREVMDELASGANTGEADLARTMRNAAYGVLLARRSVTRLFEASGGSAAFLANRLQRTFRDVHAAGGHIGLAWDRNASFYGRWRAGLGLKGAYPGV
jgi:alkylation response protein AidB-like acyl-CoA dehydrogenase